MKNLLLILVMAASSLLFASTGCITQFSVAWANENKRVITALNACSLLPNGGPGCVNHAYENHDRNTQQILDDYDCCEFNDC